MQTVVDKFKFHAGRLHSGLIQISKGHYTGGIYLQDGRVVHAELYDKSGLDAVFELFMWGEAVNIWRQGQIPERFTTNFPLEYVLECYEKEKKTRTKKRPQTPDANLLRDQESDTAEAEEAAPAAVNFNKFMVILECRSTDWRVKEYPLTDADKKSYIIGSDLNCDIQLNHKSIVDQHCAILLDEVLRLWDLGTGGATLVNDQVTEDAVLEPGDRLQIGSLLFVVNLKLRRAASGTGAARAASDNKSKIAASQGDSRKNMVLTGPISFHKIQDKKERTKPVVVRKSILAGIFAKNKNNPGKPAQKKGK